MPNILEKLKPAQHIVTKYNEAEFKMMFDGFIRDVDKVIAEHKRRLDNLDLPIRKEPAPYQGSDEPSMDDGYVSDWRDEAGITDASAESERFK